MANKLTSAQREELKNAFNLFDKDGSGTISNRELDSVFKALNVKLNDDQLKQLTKEIDLDGSGQIEFEEFCRVMAATYFKPYTQEEIRTEFRQFDQDGSGYIQAEELENILQRMGRRYNKDQIDAMINSVDKSGDGKIGFDEFLLLFQ